ncbi:hypothetical protein [Haloarcula marina]|uniref:hypothetical protein n=1 Tax=Haloarcula marina TaxID=2961574 RepID=UPI0020B7D1D4|nr:hypothetical protein [Halomicroarcula marina]
MIRIRPTTSRSAPSCSGLSADDGEWRLEPSRYRRFTAEVTGIELTENLGASEYYRIRNRLEAFIAERKRDGEWSASLVERYPDVNTLEEIVSLTRFLRECHDCCLETELA